MWTHMSNSCFWEARKSSDKHTLCSCIILQSRPVVPPPQLLSCHHTTTYSFTQDLREFLVSSVWGVSRVGSFTRFIEFHVTIEVTKEPFIMLQPSQRIRFDNYYNYRLLTTSRLIALR
ncbi:hypothetical protein J6590_038865 [Homalodisca vitripennis]|nr:hypothetical protein J6590_038865 [Homalodisca vitripennis]